MTEFRPASRFCPARPTAGPAVFLVIVCLVANPFDAQTHGAGVPGDSLKSALGKIETVNDRLSQLERLLAMPETERTATLASRPDTEKFLKAELAKYDQMDPDERLEALQSLRTWYYLRVLVLIPEETRPPVLERISATDRELLEKRLRRWDRLDAGLQREVLQHERFIRYVLQLDGLPRSEQKALATALPEGLKKDWDDKLSQWHDVPSERRKDIYLNFKKFFDLSAVERNKVLQTMSRQELEQARPTLEAIAALEKLTPEERAACLESFKSFAETHPQSTNYLLHLETFQRWNGLSAEERDLLRRASRALAPLPLPPLPGEASKPPMPLNRQPPPLPGSQPQ